MARPSPCEGVGAGKFAGWLAQIAHQPAGGEGGQKQHSAERRELAWRVMTGGLDHEDQHGKTDYQQRQSAVEAACLGVRPGVEGADDLPSKIGVGAFGLTRAGIADLRLGAVADQSPLAVELLRPQRLALRTDPQVVLGSVLEAGRAVSQRTSVGECRQPLEREGRKDEGPSVAAGE